MWLSRASRVSASHYGYLTKPRTLKQKAKRVFGLAEEAPRLGRFLGFLPIGLCGCGGVLKK